MEVREENPTEDEKPAPPPVTVAPPPTIRNDKNNDIENVTVHKLSKQTGSSTAESIQPKA